MALARRLSMLHVRIIASARQRTVGPSLSCLRQVESRPASLGWARALSTSAGSEEYAFTAETGKLLDIVTNSLYTDKEVFLRELVSNASDALEKLRHEQNSGSEIRDGSTPLEIRISADAEAGTLTLEDTGVGMTRDEMASNLGTIARSGSRAFLEAGGDSGGIIGQFGVGFYSAFMVGSRVEVLSRPSVLGEDGAATPVHAWESSGEGTYSLLPLAEDDERAASLRGTRIVIHLKEDCEEYGRPERVREVIERYSNFVNYPIVLDGERVNTTEAVWAKDAAEISDEEYNDFYRYVAGAFDEPSLRLHFKADAPIELKALLFVGSQHQEKYGMARMKPGVSLYSRKVLLESSSEEILPEWMRFVKGVVDSEDLPLSISRENMQDSALLRRMRKVLSRRVLRMFADTAKRDLPKYLKFHDEFGTFLKEGICTDYDNQGTPAQDQIYYLSAPSRELALASPYYEIFKQKEVEVLFLFNPIDDFVMSNLGSYNGRQLVAADSGQVKLKVGDEEDAKSSDSDEEDKDNDVDAKAKEAAEGVRVWLEQALAEHVTEVKVSTRLVDSPAIVVDHESAALRRMMRMLDHQQGKRTAGDTVALPKQRLEISADHPVITDLDSLRNSNPALAETAARQLFDNAVIGAGLIDDARTLLPRLNDVLAKLVASSGGKS